MVSGGGRDDAHALERTPSLIPSRAHSLTPSRAHSLTYTPAHALTLTLAFTGAVAVTHLLDQTASAVNIHVAIPLSPSSPSLRRTRMGFRTLH